MKKLKQSELTKLLNQGDPIEQHKMLASIGVTPIVDPLTSMLIVYDTAIEKAMCRVVNPNPVVMNLDALQ